MSNRPKIKKKTQQTEFRIDRNLVQPIACGKCGSKYFEQVYGVVRIPAVVSPTGQEIINTDGFLRCIGCGRCAKLQHIEQKDEELNH